MQEGNLKRGMVNSFSDASDTNYDKAINKSKK